MRERVVASMLSSSAARLASEAALAAALASSRVATGVCSDEPYNARDEVTSSLLVHTCCTHTDDRQN
jgi:hypothetical protein